MRALYDLRASCTAVSPIGLHIATACGKKIKPDRGTVAALGHMDLSFGVAGIRPRRIGSSEFHWI